LSESEMTSVVAAVASVPEWARHRSGLATKYAGPVAWVMLHGLYNSLCEGGHFANNPRARPLLLAILSSFGRAFPCIHCRRSIPGFVSELADAFNEGRAGHNLMRDLHNSVNKKLYDQAHRGDAKAIESGGLLKTPNYGVIIHHRVEDVGWDISTMHFLLYCAARIHDSNADGADHKPEGDREPDLVHMLERLNEAMVILHHPPLHMPSSDTDLEFPLDSAHPAKCAQMMRNLVAAFSG
jgi:hypothetical protein